MRKVFWVLITALAVGMALAPQAARASDSSDSEDFVRVTMQGMLSAISTTTPPATLMVTVNGAAYTVNVSTTTKIVRKFYGVSTLEEFMVGDRLEVIGSIGATTTTVEATRIRDISIQRRGGAFKGKIGALTCASNSFMFTPDRRTEQTVYSTSSTRIIRHGEKITCTDLLEGERAVVIGLWRPGSSRIDADRVIVKSDKVEGRITAITLTDGGLPATITLDRSNHKKDKSAWTINVTSKTKLRYKGLETATINAFKIGDRVQALGAAVEAKLLNAVILRGLSVSKPKDDSD